MGPYTVDDSGARFGLVLLILVALFFVSGLAGTTGNRTMTLLTVLLVMAVFRLTELTTSIPSMIGLVVMAVTVLTMVALTETGSGWRAMAYVLQFALLMIIAVALLAAALGRQQVDAQTIIGLIAVYVLIGLAFSWLLLAIDLWDDAQLTLQPADTPGYFEFSFVTLTTVGFGNEYPTAPLAGRLVMVEALLGQLFLTTVVARLVALYGRSHREAGR